MKSSKSLNKKAGIIRLFVFIRNYRVSLSSFGGCGASVGAVPKGTCGFPFLTATKYITRAIATIEARITKIVLVDMDKV